MDPKFNGVHDPINFAKFEDEIVYPSFVEPPSLFNVSHSKENTLDVNFTNSPFPLSVLDPANFLPSSGTGYEVDSPDDNDSDPVLRYLNQILLEENMEERPSMFLDPFALHTSDKSLYDVLGKTRPAPSYQQNQNADSPDSLCGNSSEYSTSSYTTNGSFIDPVDPNWMVDPWGYRPSIGQSDAVDYPMKSPQTNAEYSINSDSNLSNANGQGGGFTYGNLFQSDVVDYPLKSPQTNAEYSINSDSNLGNANGQRDGLTYGNLFQSDAVDYPLKSPQTNAEYSINPDRNLGNANGQRDGLTYENLFQNIFNDSESMMQFKKGVEEASKFLPTANQLIIDLDKYNLPPKSNEILPNPSIKLEKDESEHSVSASKGRKHLHRQESQVEEQRSSKQSAVYIEEVELSEMFDRVLLFTDAGNAICCSSNSQVAEADKTSEHIRVMSGSTSGKTRSRNQGNKSETVDLRTLLISCAQSVASDDRRTAYEQLKQIRQHSSATGDACQRLANIFTNGLEARLAGNGSQIYAASKSKKISAVEKLKAYQVYLSACPFKKISIFFANKMILHAASKATTLHIVDFGIIYGFQWPILIQHLSNLPGGPPRLRITGIEHPQPGFRPAELVEETGRRLARYCERFHVPFEYQAIATQNWETIKMDDLKIVKGEVLAVNSLFRFKNLLDETVVEDNPRDAVLKLVREMNPDIFVNSIINGSYSAPFFVTRFREALFHYSSLFDIFEATLSCEDEHRLNFEQVFYGREVMNVISCEGPERVERPETYKQWQVRHKRAGLKPLPLNGELLNKLRCKVKAGYHKDFVFDEDGSWMLQGWKGRIVCASSCWVPA